MGYNFSNEQLAYTAGIIDGEGYITIEKHKQYAKCKRGYVYRLLVCVVNTNELLIDWLVMNFGGSIGRQDGLLPSHKVSFHWSLYGRQAAQFLELVLPYLILKRPHAEIGLAYQKRRKGTNPHKTDEEWALDEANKILIDSYNKKGVPNKLRL